jgi:hypothetical protein
MWAIAIPPDVIKSRIQSAPTGTYSGFVDCARKTIAADGVAALWRGFGPAMLRVRISYILSHSKVPNVRFFFKKKSGIPGECCDFRKLPIYDDNCHLADSFIQLGVEATKKALDKFM